MPSPTPWRKMADLFFLVLFVMSGLSLIVDWLIGTFRKRPMLRIVRGKNEKCAYGIKEKQPTRLLKVTPSAKIILHAGWAAPPLDIRRGSDQGSCN
jgi:hypothetical protein